MDLDMALNTHRQVIMIGIWLLHQRLVGTLNTLRQAIMTDRWQSYKWLLKQHHSFFHSRIKDK